MFENSTDDLIMEKLIVLYILNNLKEDVTESQLTHIILSTEAMDYFPLMTVLPKMLESKFVVKYKKSDLMLYSITQSGLEVLMHFQNRIPSSLINKIDSYIKLNEEEIFSSMIKKQASYSLHDDMTYEVVLTLIKRRENILTLNINVNNENEAKYICYKWENTEDDRYTQILSLLKS